MKNAKINLKSAGLLLFTFVLLKELLSLVADVLQIQQALESLWPVLADVPDRVWQFTFGVISVGVMLAAVGVYRSRRLRDTRIIEKWDPPGSKFTNDPSLIIRYVADEFEIEQLAKTENYGGHGETNLPQVKEWWHAYQRGNVLALYKGKIVGGIDVWPLKKSAYSDMLRGRLGEDGLTAQHLAAVSRRRNESYWYIGSISLSMVWKNGQARKELLLRLLVNTLLLWRANSPVYPANFIALVWTPEGMNLLRRNGFASIISAERPKGADPCFQRRVENDEEMSEVIEDYKCRLFEHSADRGRTHHSTGPAQKVAQAC